MIVAIALVVALIVTLALTFSPFPRSDGWRATVTPLASIIGSGFLICGPLLAREFGSAAILAMGLLLAIAYAAGWVIRFNITHVENHLAVATFNDPIAWVARITQGVLALAYAVSVAYYLKLLAEFTLKPIAIDPAWQPVAANIIVTVIIALMTLLALGGSLRKVEHLAHGTVSIDCLGHTNASLAGTTSWAFGKDGTIKVPIAGSMCSDNGEALVRAAIAGQGLVYGPRFIAAEALRAGQLSELELDEPPMILGAAYAITHPTRRPAAKTRAWIDFLAEALPARGTDW